MINILEVEKMQAEHLARMKVESPRFAAHLERAWKGKSRIALVKAMCLECQGRDGEAVEAIRRCSSPTCPLFNARTFQ